MMKGDVNQLSNLGQVMAEQARRLDPANGSGGDISSMISVAPVSSVSRPSVRRRP
jgi:hypothetical protein